MASTKMIIFLVLGVATIAAAYPQYEKDGYFGSYIRRSKYGSLYGVGQNSGYESHSGVEQDSGHGSHARGRRQERGYKVLPRFFQEDRYRSHDSGRMDGYGSHAGIGQQEEYGSHAGIGQEGGYGSHSGVGQNSGYGSHAGGGYGQHESSHGSYAGVKH